MPGLRMAGEIVGRADDDAPAGAAGTDGDHVGLKAFAQAKARVAAAFDDILETVRGADVQFDQRISGDEFGDAAHHHLVGGQVRHGDAQGPRGDLGPGGGLGQGGPDLVQRAAHPFQQTGAFVGRAGGPRGAGQQAHAQIRLEQGHGLADGRGRDAQAIRRAAKAAKLGHGAKDDQTGQMRTLHCSVR